MAVYKGKRVNFNYNIGSLAASATYSSPWIDLHDYPEMVRVVATKLAVSGAGEQLVLQGQNEDWGGSNSPLPGMGANNSLAQNTSSATNMSVTGIPQCRYVRVTYINSATAQSALKISLALLAS